MQRNLVYLIAQSLLVLILGSCGGGGGAGTNSSGASLQSIAVTPATPSVANGFTKQLQAMGTYSDGTTIDISSKVSWASSNAAVASITSTGLATGSAVGGADITATVGAVSAHVTLSVTSATLLSISVTPATASLAVGVTRQFTATGSYSDGTTVDISSQVAWTTSSAAVASVTSTGLATAAGAGNATVTATSGAISGSSTLTVTTAALQSMVVAPMVRSIATGLTVQYTAVGVYSDGSMPDITSQVTWASANAAAATVSTSGLATAAGAGSTTISATSGTVSGGATLSVTTATLQSIVVTPAPASVTSGSTTQLTAVGTYSDGTSADITSQVTWSSSNTSVATVVASGLASGGATLGSATITASSGGLSASTTLQVAANPASATSFAISGSNPVNPGGTTTFTGTVCAGCSYSIDPAAGIASSGVASGTLSATTNALQTSTTFTLTVVNQAGVSSSQAVTVSVNRPSGSSFYGPSSWTTGKAGIPLVATFGGGSGASASVVATSGSTGSTCTPASSTTSPQTFVCGAISADTTYTLTVSLGSGSNSTSTDTLLVKLAPTESTTAGTMPARFGAALAVLPNGKVLIAGGSTTAPSFGSLITTNTAQIFDPSAGTFVQAGAGAGCTGSNTTMAAGRYLGTATLLPNGKVLLAGGSTNGGSSGATNLADLYDVNADCFTQLGLSSSLNTARFRHTATLLPNGKVLIAGGTDKTGVALSSGELFDPAAAAFNFTLISGQMVTARSDATATLMQNGLVLIAGGTATAVKGELFDYNSPTSFSQTSGAMQVARSQHTATLLGSGSVLFAGGSGATPPSSAINSAEQYNPTTGLFGTVAGSLGTARFAHTATLLPSGTVFIAGGTTSSGFATLSTELFDPTTATFSAAPFMFVPRTQAVATFLSNGTALVTGGYAATISGDLFTP